jgi:hypothetical protein
LEQPSKKGAKRGWRGERKIEEKQQEREEKRGAALSIRVCVSP